MSSSYAGPVKNPWNLNMRTIESLGDKNDNSWYISGGSSGGAAASVAADIAELYAF